MGVPVRQVAVREAQTGLIIGVVVELFAPCAVASVGAIVGAVV